MIVSDFLKALEQITDPRFRRVLLLGLGLTFGLLFAVFALVYFGVGLIAPASITLPYIGEITWIHQLLSWGALALMMLLSVFLMVPVASAFTSLFLDDVADAVEERYYPALPPADGITFSDGLRDTVSFLGLLIVANLLALILYLFLLPLGPFIFWALNGFLLGREYFQLVAMRRLGRQGAKLLFRKHIAQIWIAGALMAIPLTIPVINLLIPILGAATFTHLYHRVTGP